MNLSIAEIREYLIGQPNEEGRRRIEETFFADTAAFDAMVDEVDVICDAYLRGGLESGERERVADLATGGLWAERMAFAKALRDVATRTSDRQGIAGGVTPEGRETRVMSFMDWVRVRDWKSQLRAAAVLLVVALGWPMYLWEARAWRADLVSARASAAGQVAAAEAVASAARRSLDSANARGAQLELAVQKQVTAEFALIPTFTRGEDSPLVVPTRAALIKLELALEEGAPPGPYRATITSSSGATVHSATAVTAMRGVPVVVVPAQSLPAGEYRLTLSLARGVAAGAVAPIAEFVFRVTRR